jgi:acyl transferase domain-containing protein
MSGESGKIAIIGMSGAFPGCANVDEFWDNLCLGKEMIRFCGSPPAEGLNAASHPAKWVPVLACMDGIDLFDADFFGITPHEAEITDPQHRILLEHSWRAMEHAGYDCRGYTGATGVFAGATINTYLLQNIASNPGLVRSLDPVKVNVGNGADFLTTRISYKLNLRGPSHAVQSACSTSLVAVHCACRSLLDFECDMALAGGVSINVTLLQGYRYQEGGIVSPDGHCRPFDAQAQGTVFGGGVGVVVLKRLEDAITDGDCIHAVVCGSAINNDGLQKAGFTAPSVEGQAEVIVEALSSAGLSPEEIGYIECHGTGTPLGDPVEVRALSKAFGRGKAGTCALGSVKSNVGHLDAAAGVAGLIKAVLCLQHKTLPPTLHFHEPNPQINFAESPFYVNTALKPWQNECGTLRAGVSAFGVGGTNAHIVLEEAPPQGSYPRGRSVQLLAISARTRKALAQMADNLANHLLGHENLELEDVAYTLQCGRQHFACRHTVVCRTREEAITLLRQAPALLDAGMPVVGEGGAQEGPPGVVFMFPGQGAQHAGMGQELYREELVFRRHLDQCSEILRPYLGLDLNQLISSGRQEEEINQTWLAQPALFALEWALAQLWMAWGLKPQAMLGHSLGEYTAACIARVMTLEEGLGLVAERGRLMQQAPPGAMVAIPLSSEQTGRLLKQELEIAAINAPDLTVVSGPVAEIEELQKRLLQQKVECRRLHTSHGFHSRSMDGAIAPFVETVKKVRLRAPEAPVISCVTGKFLRAEDAIDPMYWGRQMRAPVQFAEGIREVMTRGGRVMLEVGPGQGTCRLAARQWKTMTDRLLLPSMPGSVHGNQCEALMNALGRMWEAVVQIDWSSFHAQQRRRRVPLPAYPFERKRYWITSDDSGSRATASQPERIHSDHRRESPAALPENTRPLLRNAYVTPNNEIERTIVSIVEKVLGIHPVGVTDNFGDLGGDSLAAVTVVNEINSRFECNLRVADFYEKPAARDVALSISICKGFPGDGSQNPAAEEEESRKLLLRDQYLARRRTGRQTADS